MRTDNKKDVLRKCIICKEQLDKRELYRIVRVDDTTVELDSTYKKNGRGAYISRDEKCINDPKLRFKLQNALKVKLSEEAFSELMQEIKKDE